MYTRDEVKSDLALRIAQAMYMEPNEIGDDDIFSDFGLESVTLAKIVDGLNRHYGRAITIAEMLPHQTLRDASALIHEKLSGEPQP